MNATERAAHATIVAYHRERERLEQNPKLTNMTKMQSYTTGEQMMMIPVRGVVMFRRDGYVLVGSSILRDFTFGKVKKTSAGVSQMDVTYCEDLSRIYLLKKGKKQPPAMKSAPTTMTVRLVDGKWLIADMRNEDKRC